MFDQMSRHLHVAVTLTHKINHHTLCVCQAEVLLIGAQRGTRHSSQLSFGEIQFSQPFNEPSEEPISMAETKPVRP